MSSVVEIQSFYEFLVVKHDTLSIEVRRTIYHLLFAFSHETPGGCSAADSAWTRSVGYVMLT